MKIITQDLVDHVFMVRNGTYGGYYVQEDVDKVKAVVHQKFGVVLSTAETVDFWRWRCQEWDGSWFDVDVERDVELIVEYFEEFLKFVGVETAENSEDYSRTTQRAGVKVIVKDDDGALWELELEPEYHAQLISELEAQIPEKSEGTSIKYSLEYLPEKIWNVRKIDEAELAALTLSVREREKFQK